MIFTFLISSLLAQVEGTVTTSYDRAGESQILTLNASVLAAKLTFTASGAWTLNKGTCTTFAFQPTSGGAGAQTVYAMPGSLSTTVSISGGSNDQTGTCSGDVSGSAFSISWRARRPDGNFTTDFSGNFDSAWHAGCSKSNSLHGYKNSCPGTTAYAPQDGVALPANGSIISDPLFGGRGLRCGGTSAQPYGGYSFNRDESLYISPGGIISTTDCTVAAALPSSAICSGYSTMYWDYRAGGTAQGGWCFYTSTPFRIKAWHISGGSVVDDGTIFTHAYNLADHGSTGNPINADGWIVFPDSNHQNCIIHAPTGASSLKCLDIGHADSVVRHVQIAPRSDADGKLRFMHGSDGLTPPDFSDHRTYVYDPIAGTVSLQARIPNVDRGWLFGDNWGHASGYDCASTGNNGCFLRYGHGTTWSNRGASGMFGNFITYQGNGGSNYIYGFQGCSWTNGTDGCLPREYGGGGLSRRVGHGTEYVVCAVGSPVCGTVGYGNEDRARRITATEAAGTCTGTVSGTNVFSASQRVLMNKFPAAGWNGYVTLSTSVGSTITWSCSGAGTAQTGYAIAATVLTSGSSPLWHVGACRMDNGHCRIASKWQGTTTADVAADAYLDGVLGQISFRGTLLKVNDSMGYPEQGGLTIWDTGFVGCTERTKENDFCGGGGLRVERITATTALATATTPYASGACTLEWGQTNDFSGWTQQALSAGSAVRTHTITGLTAGQEYKARLWCDGTHRGAVKTNWHYAIDRWQQPASVSGSVADVVVVGGPAPTGTADMVLTYGATNPPASTAIVTCSAGERCMAIGTFNRNAVTYFRLTWRNAGAGTIKETGVNIKVLR